MKRHRGHGNSYKEKYLFEVAAYSFRGLAHYHHGREHGGWECDSMRADMGLEKELRIQRLDPKATGSGLIYWSWLEHI